jgi:hypothetical protein
LPATVRLVPYRAPRRIGAALQLLAGLNVPATLEAFNDGDAEIEADFEASTGAGFEP